LHPTPALGGYPQEEAVMEIKQIENLDRGWYAGPVGWIDHQGNGEFAVAIRSGLLNGDQAKLYAGCGIVGDSDLHSEYEETKMKFKPMLTALGGTQYD
ncbi:MAG: chorismate-binding protein, partial [Anaerobacillus sp.]